MADELADVANGGTTLGEEQGDVECEGVGQIEALRSLARTKSATT